MYNCHGIITAVHKAYKMLQEEEQKGYVLEVVEDAKAMLDMKVNAYLQSS